MGVQWKKWGLIFTLHNRLYYYDAASNETERDSLYGVNGVKLGQP